MVTNSIPHVYILISPEYTDAIGKKNVKNENSIPSFSPKSFFMCVYPRIPNIAIGIIDAILYKYMLEPNIIYIKCNIQ